MRGQFAFFACKPRELPLNGFATRRQRSGFPHCKLLPQAYYSFLEGQNAPKEQTQAQTRASTLNGGTYVHSDSIHRF